MDFKLGEKVRLKGGGYSPGMIVNKLEVKGKPDHVECKWYSSREDKFVVQAFHKDTLALDTGKSGYCGKGKY